MGNCMIGIVSPEFLEHAPVRPRRAVRGEAAFSRWPGMGWRWRVGLCAGGGGIVGGARRFDNSSEWILLWTTIE